MIGLAVELLYGTATQSSVGWSGSPGRAVDGNTHQQYGGGSCTHTQNNSPWWRLTLDQEMSIDRVEVWNRADCCGSRLNGVEIKVGSQLCGTLSSSTAKQEIGCNGKVGTVVELSMPRNDYLTLCEVKAFGTATPGATVVISFCYQYPCHDPCMCYPISSNRFHSWRFCRSPP